jgi:hypothetical protein
MAWPLLNSAVLFYPVSDRFESCRSAAALAQALCEQEVRMRAGMWKMTCVALAAGGAVSLAAQGGPTTEKSAGELIAAVGCIAKADGAAGGRGAANAGPGSTYMLTKVTPAPADVVPTDATGNKPKAPSATQYRLTGSDSMIGLYDGHQVQITGTVEQSAAGRGAGSGGAPTLKVDTVYVRSNTCP